MLVLQDDFVEIAVVCASSDLSDVACVDRDVDQVVSRLTLREKNWGFCAIRQNHLNAAK